MVRFGRLVSLISAVALESHPCGGFDAKRGGGKRLRYTPVTTSVVKTPAVTIEGERAVAVNRYGERAHGYRRAGGPIDPSTCGLSLNEIHDLIVERMHCRRMRDFRTADHILRRMNEQGVRVNDRLRQWYVDAAENGDPDMRNCGTLGEMVQLAYDHANGMSPRGLSAFWTLTSKFLQGNGRGKMGSREQMEHRLGAMLTKTRRAIDSASFSHRDLATTSLGLAKIVKAADRKGSPRGSPHRILSDLIVCDGEGDEECIFCSIAAASVRVIRQFDARCLSNLMYAFVVSGCAPKLKDGTAFFDIVAAEAVRPAKLKRFRPQELSNMLWAYANRAPNSTDFFEAVADHVVDRRRDLGAYNGQDLANVVWAYATARQHHPGLFEKVAGHIAARGSLDAFNGQDFANIVWAYATAREPSPALFWAVANHVVRQDKLSAFNSQNIANTLWAYATAKEPSPALFKAAADYIVGLESLNSFNSQALANIVWAYATAGESNSKLFDKVASHIASLDRLDGFTPQALSNTAWAFAKSRVSSPQLFKKLSAAAIDKQREFSSQNVGNFLWAYAKNGEMERGLFMAFAPSISAILGECNHQELANIAWAYSVADVASPSVFDDAFVQSCLKNEMEFTGEELSQLHQWSAWQEEAGSKIVLPPTIPKPVLA